MKYKVSYHKHHKSGWTELIIKPRKKVLSYSKGVKLAKKIKKKYDNKVSSVHLMYISGHEVVRYELIAS